MTENQAPPEEQTFTLQLTQRQLAALINRLVPADTWMGRQSARVVKETFSSPEEAARVADEATMKLIYVHDEKL
jgi:hypothetical protein